MISLAVFNVFAIEEVKLAGVKLASFKGKGESYEMRDVGGVLTPNK